MAHLANTNGNHATYVVQVYSAFSPPHLTPLLVRLSESATVREAIHAALSKLLDQDPTIVLPSDLVEEYAMRCAGGEGQPLYQSLPFDHATVLREATGLAFPFMVHLGYVTGRDRTLMMNANDATAVGDDTSNNGGGVLGGAKGKHVPLSAIEKAALEAHRREIEARRAENVKQIERRRFEHQMNALHHSENYELKRKEEAAKREAALLKQEQERLLQQRKEVLNQARDEESRRAQLEAVKKGNERVVEQMRNEMQNAIAGDAKRREDLAEALEIKRREMAHAAEMEREKKRLFLEAQRQQRTTNDFDNLLNDLHASIDVDVSTNEVNVSADRNRRQLFQRADADSHAIALIEQQRNYMKLNSRQERRNKEELDQQRMSLLREQQEAMRLEEEERKNAVLLEWKDKQEVNREAMTSRLEEEFLRQKIGNETANNNNHTAASSADASNPWGSIPSGAASAVNQHNYSIGYGIAAL